MNFDRKRMCPNCPFRKKGAIDLMPGRVESIVEGLVKDDHTTFSCHETSHLRKKERSACMGALAYTQSRHGRISVLARVAIHLGMLKQTDLDACEKHLRD